MTDEELIKQLRDITFFIGSLEELAADRIEQLVKEQERLEEQCEGLARVAMNNGSALLTAEAKLAKAVEALREMLEDPEYWSPYARATLAELEGALSSIARNTCCDKCQEAALVARAALSGETGE